MTWKAHADYVCKKVASRVKILGCVRRFVTKEAATLVHIALILPLLDYCDIAWSNLLQQDIDRLQRLQNRSARIITRCSRSFEAIEQLHDPGCQRSSRSPAQFCRPPMRKNPLAPRVQLHWPTLSSRRFYHKAKTRFSLSTLISS